MPSSRRCVFGCVTKGVTVHSFPNPKEFPERFCTWVELGGDQLKNLSNDEIYPRKKVCDKHFKDCHRNRNNRLNALAVPSLNLPGTHKKQNICVDAEKGSAGNSNMPSQNNVPSAALCLSDTQPAMPTLWKTDASPPSCAVRILADILGIKFDYVDIDFGKLDHKAPEYLKLNPAGIIPLLKDGDFLLSDSHAILKYLLEKYGSVEQRESFYPKSLETRAIIDQAMFYDTGVYFIRLKLVALPAFFGNETEASPRVLQEIEDAYTVVEAYLTKNKFIAADHLTLADISLGSTTGCLQPILKLDKTKFPRTVAWMEGLNQIPAFRKYTEPGFKMLGEFIQGAWERNKLKQQ